VIDDYAISPVPWLEIDDSIASVSECDTPVLLHTQDQPDVMDHGDDFFVKLRPCLCDSDWRHNIGSAGSSFLS